MSARSLVLVLVLLGGCEAGAAGVDADAMRLDATIVDAGIIDATTVDAAITDAAIDDAAIADAAIVDAAIAPVDASFVAGGLAEIVPRVLYESMFPHRDDPACRGAFFGYDALLDAAARFPVFAAAGTYDDRRREAAAFLANVSHETTGGWPTAPDGPQSWGLCFIEEVGCESGACTGYCASSAAYPCAPGRTYHGRGPMQLSWNYNYGQAGDALGVDLLNDPDLVTRDATISWLTAIWFWMTPQPPKPSCHDVMTGAFTPSAADVSAGRVPGFGLTINIINGGLECGRPTDGRVEDRVAFYRRYCELLGVDPGPALTCEAMTSY